MSDNNALLSMAQEFSGLPMEALVGGPLKAAANANAAMALTQTKFMLDTCFTGGSDTSGDKGGVDSSSSGANYRPIMINMTISRPVIAEGTAEPGQTPPVSTSTVETTFNLPLLTIIPLNSLAVDSAEVTFEMEVKSSFSEDTSETKESSRSASAELDAKLGWGPLSVSIKGNASYDSKDSSTHDTHYQKSNSAKYTVNVHAGQLTPPEGVKTIITAFTKSIQPIEVKASASGGSDGNK